MDELNQERIERCKRILEKYNKPKVERVFEPYKPLTQKEIKMFQDMGSIVTIVDNTPQQKLF